MMRAGDKVVFLRSDGLKTLGGRRAARVVFRGEVAHVEKMATDRPGHCLVQLGNGDLALASFDILALAPAG